jgi:hypothetical protein
VAGLTSGARGAGAGSLTALTTWGLVALVVAVVVVPTFSIGHVPNFVTVSAHVYKINYLSYWTVFWSVLIGLGAALLGGLIGGSIPRRVDGPYLDLSRTTTNETGPTVVRRPQVVEQMVPTATGPAPLDSQNVMNVPSSDATAATGPVTSEFP